MAWHLGLYSWRYKWDKGKATCKPCLTSALWSVGSVIVPQLGNTAQLLLVYSQETYTWICVTCGCCMLFPKCSPARGSGEREYHNVYIKRFDSRTRKGKQSWPSPVPDLLGAATTWMRRSVEVHFSVYESCGLEVTSCWSALRGQIRHWAWK